MKLNVTMYLVCVLTEGKSQSSKKKKFFLKIGIFLFKIGEKSHLNSIGNGAEFWPLNTQKKIPVSSIILKPITSWMKLVLLTDKGQEILS